MRESPRIRRLRSDQRAMEKLRAESTVVDFNIPGAMHGGVPDSYTIYFHGKGVWRPEGKSDILVRERHQVSVRLGASYPRMIPEMAWKTPIFHPNISAGGVVCLGGYGTHWVPSLQLDELCSMLWDMIRFANYDTESPYNREAALWAKEQSVFRFPLDSRPIRDRVTGGQTVAPPPPAVPPQQPQVVPPQQPQVVPPPPPENPWSLNQPNPAALFPQANQGDDEVMFLGDVEVVDAEIVREPPAPESPDILFIE